MYVWGVFGCFVRTDCATHCLCLPRVVGQLFTIRPHNYFGKNDARCSRVEHSERIVFAVQPPKQNTRMVAHRNGVGGVFIVESDVERSFIVTCKREPREYGVERGKKTTKYRTHWKTQNLLHQKERNYNVEEGET